MARKSPELSERQRAFVREYLVDLDGRAAAIRAGYSPHGAAVQACRLLKFKAVSEAVQKAMAARAHRVEVRADDILRELLRVALADVRQAFDEQGRLLPLHKMPEDVARALAGVEVVELLDGSGVVRKAKFWPKVQALELLGKHLGLLKEIVEHQGKVTLEQLVAGSMQPPPGDAP